MTPGEKLNTQLGYTLVVGKPVGEGGQGMVNQASIVGRSRDRFIAKIFSDEFDREAIHKRNVFLMNKQFHVKCAIFHTPVDLIVHSKHVGYVAFFAPGEPLDTFLSNNKHTVTQALVVALAIAHAVKVMHDAGVAHGDIKPDNVLLNWRGSVIEVHFVDCDNFRAHGAPLPFCFGDSPFVAPEIQAGIESNKPYYPDVESDRFALGVLIHVVLLLFHPAAGFDATPETYRRALWEGAWLHNPYCNRNGKFKDGRPSEILNGHIADLIARSMSKDRAKRPKADEWCKGLSTALREITPCPECNRVMLADPGRQVCPYDGHPFPSLNVVCPGGIRIPISSGNVVIGRDELRSECVSRLHAVFRKQATETVMEIHGQNGAWRFVGGVWKPLAQKTPIPIAKGDRLRFGDVDFTIG